MTSSQLESKAGLGSWELGGPSKPALPGPTTSHVAAGVASKGTAHVPAAAQQPPRPKLAGKTSLLPLDKIDFALMAVIMFSLSLAGGAGIGGGAILVPVYLMLRGEQASCASLLAVDSSRRICSDAHHDPTQLTKPVCLCV